MTTATIYRLALPKSKLAALGETERRLVLVMGHAANELSTLQRLVVFSLQPEWNDEVLDKIATGRANVLIRLLAGKAWETVELIRRRVQENRVAVSYVAKMTDEGRGAFDRIRKLWGQDEGAILPALRKFHAFHYPSNEAIDAAFDEIGDDEPLEAYLTDKGVDGTFFQMSELVFSVAATHVVKSGSFAERLDRVSRVVVDLTGDLVQFIQHFTGTVLEHASDALEAEAGIVRVDVLTLEEISVPPVSVRTQR